MGIRRLARNIRKRSQANLPSTGVPGDTLVIENANKQSKELEQPQDVKETDAVGEPGELARATSGEEKSEALEQQQQVNRSEREQRVRNAAEFREAPQSVLFFTTYKCASSFMSFFFNKLLEGTPYRQFNYASEMWRLGHEFDFTVSPSEALSNHYDHFFRQRGEIYVPLREAVRFPGDDRFRKLFFLRDPRDVLISQYYSVTQSHALPKNPATRKRMLKNRAYWAELGIDEVSVNVLAPRYAAIYKDYDEIRRSSGDHLFLSYDDYTRDVEEFTLSISKWLLVEPSEATLAAIVSKANPISNKVDSSKHQRSGRSRQFMSELQPDTVQKLNETLGEALQSWGFEV